jgi:diaminohydroxyphosphoribosylaminopyrimidine deaminase/5-amino-6-(5-phosphoribosylamino)uracil reductase
MKSAPTEGATLYVTLEPCCTHGRTPPCTDAIIAAGIKRVVVAATDPNPKHRGRGLRLLRRAGLRVEAGLLAEEATALNPAFNKWIVTGLPLVIAKAALSLDGKMATRTGDSKWITSDAARREAHRLRAQVDAIMVGGNTVRRDNPQLTLRHGVRGRQPWRVVVGHCPRTAHVFTDAHRDRTLHFTTRNLRAVLRKLGRQGITSVLIEGGPTLLSAAFDAGLVDRVAFFYAPRVIAGAAKVAGATVWRGKWRRVGDDEMLFEGAR